MCQRELTTPCGLRQLPLVAGAAAALLTACTVTPSDPRVRAAVPQAHGIGAPTALVRWSSGDEDTVAVAQSRDRQQVGVLSSRGSVLRLTNVDVRTASTQWHLDLPAGTHPSIQSAKQSYVVVIGSAPRVSVRTVDQHSGRTVRACTLPDSPMVTARDAVWVRGEQWSMRTCRRTGTRLESQPVMGSSQAVIVKHETSFEVRASPHLPRILRGTPLVVTDSSAAFTTADQFCALDLRNSTRRCVSLRGRLVGLRHVQGPAWDNFAILASGGTLEVLSDGRGRLRRLRSWEHVSDLFAMSDDAVVFRMDGRTEWRRIADDAVVARLPDGGLPLYVQGETAVLSAGRIMLAR